MRILAVHSFLFCILYCFLTLRIVPPYDLKSRDERYCTINESKMAACQVFDRRSLIGQLDVFIIYSGLATASIMNLTATTSARVLATNPSAPLLSSGTALHLPFQHGHCPLHLGRQTQHQRKHQHQGKHPLRQSIPLTQQDQGLQVDTPPITSGSGACPKTRSDTPDARRATPSASDHATPTVGLSTFEVSGPTPPPPDLRRPIYKERWDQHFLGHPQGRLLW